jgi:hypothetical protein
VTHLRQLMLEELERRHYAPKTIHCYIRVARPPQKKSTQQPLTPRTRFGGESLFRYAPEPRFPRKQLHPYPYCYYWSPFVPPQWSPFTPPLTLASNWRPITGAKGVSEAFRELSVACIVNELPPIKTLSRR